VRHVQHLEAAGEAFRQPTLDKQWSGAEDQDAERGAGARVFIPQAFYRLGPAGDLLDLVECEHWTGQLVRPHQQPRGVPLLRDPLGSLERRLVARGVNRALSPGVECLPDDRRLADLPRAGDDLEERSWLAEPLGELRCLGK